MIRCAAHRRPELGTKLTVTVALVNVRCWQILLQKSKIEQLKKSRQNRFLDLSASALPFDPTA
jgi:hypothetical protein